MSSNIIGPFPKKYDAPSENFKEASVPLPKKLDAPSEKVEKSSDNLYGIEKLLVTTIETFDKEGTIYTIEKKGKSKPNFV